jgi:hypothetical protein
MFQAAPGISQRAGVEAQMHDMPDYLAEKHGSYLLVYIGPGEDPDGGTYLFRVPEKGMANYASGNGTETLTLSQGNAWKLSVDEGAGLFIKSRVLEKDDGSKTRITRPLSSEMLVLSDGYAHEKMFRWLFPDLDGKVVMPQEAKKENKLEPNGKNGITLGHMRSGKEIYEIMRTQYEEDLPYACSPIMVWDGPYDRGLSGSAYFFTMPRITEDIEHETRDGTETLRPAKGSIWELGGGEILRVVFEKGGEESGAERWFGIAGRESINEIAHPLSKKVCVSSGSAAMDTVFDGLLCSLYPPYTE